MKITDNITAFLATGGLLVLAGCSNAGYKNSNAGKLRYSAYCNIKELIADTIAKVPPNTIFHLKYKPTIRA